MRLILVLAFAGSLTAGCVTSDSYYQGLTSGEIGCSPGDIDISDLDKSTFTAGPETWTAACSDKRFYCTRLPAASDHDATRQVTCKEALKR